MKSRTESQRHRGAAAAIALAAACALPGCLPPESAAAQQRPANAAMMVLASGSLQGTLRAVG
jgi:hypothetical protein